MNDITVQRPEVDYMRQTLMFDPRETNGKVTIIGCGNIGSNAAIALARMGIAEIELWDDDTIEPHNLASQQYNIMDLGLAKVTALAQTLIAINPEIRVTTKQEKFTGKTEGSSAIIIIAVDTAEGRQAICKNIEGYKHILIDSRIGGHQLEIYTFSNIADWAKTIPEKSTEEPCGGRFIAYVSILTGALIACQVKKLLRNEKWSKSIMINVDSLSIMKDFEW